LLQIDNLTKRYGQLTALDDVSFSVGDGEIFGFVGANGAGKTTTMRIILGVLAPDAGRVTVDYVPIDLSMRRRIGYMPEERGLYPKMKVGEQLNYLARLHGLSNTEATASVTRWCARLQISERLNDPVSTLSLGNQQRVQLAAALVPDPVILVLDEPFSGLDPLAVDVMSTVLRDKAQTGTPVIFSSHQLELVERLSDRVGIIAGGRMRAVGTVAELQALGRRRITITAPNVPPGWLSTLPGVHERSVDGDTRVLELSDDADSQKILSRAIGFGPVTEFTPSRPSLAELFKEVVSQ